jgi:pyridoxamine 5'-phosphate oxidase
MIQNDPFAIFKDWFKNAEENKNADDASAMALATADADGYPDVRMVLLKGFDENGFVFYTNLGSAKAAQLKENPRASLCFHWEGLGRQIRIRGNIEPVSNAEADEYFAHRPRESRIGAYASKQSQKLEDSFALEKRVAYFTARFAVGNIPRPEFWSGFRLIPVYIEFWEKKPFRLHHRFVFKRTSSQSAWETMTLYP